MPEARAAIRWRRAAALSLALCAPACDDWDALWAEPPGEIVANRAFLTSTTVVPGELGGLAGGDRECQDRADAAELPGTYRAWLSSSTEDARDRLGAARGWVRTDGRPFTDSLAALTEVGQIFYPLRLDERGEEISGSTIDVATGSQAGGPDDTAGDWASTSTSYAAGDAAATTTFWDWGYDHPGDFPARLYCFGVDLEDSTPHAESSGRVAFVSAGGFAPSSLAAADALCQTEAADAELEGTFRALLSTAATPAAARFDLEGPTWIRTDRVAWLARAADLADGAILTSLNVDASGQYQGDVRVWTGSSLPGLASAGGSQSCDDWSSGAGATGITGRANMTNDRWFELDLDTCASEAHLYCLQE